MKTLTVIEAEILLNNKDLTVSHKKGTAATVPFFDHSDFKYSMLSSSVTQSLSIIGRISGVG